MIETLETLETLVDHWRPERMTEQPE